MNKNKLLFGLLPTITMILPSVVSCSKEVDQKIWFVTDGGSVDDKSFNQQGKEALEEIIHDTKPIVSIKERTTSSIVSGYEIAANFGAEYILTPGYLHSQAIDEWNKNFGMDVINFLLIDAPSNGRKDVASLLFKTQESAFLAGVLSGLYLQSIGDIDPKVGIWGGENIPSVTDYIIGYVDGIDYYNNNLLNESPKVTFAKLGSDSAYTNSGFVVGGGTPKATTLLNNGADILFPVAGPQIVDALQAVNSFGDQMVIGVDSDQSLQYPSQKDRILTSVVKDIKNGLIGLYEKAINSPQAPLWAQGPGKDSLGDVFNGLTGIMPLPSSLSSLNNIYEDSIKPEILAEAKKISLKNGINNWEKTLEQLKLM